MKQVDEPKQIYTYRTRPTVKSKAAKKAKKEKVSLSAKIEELLINYIKS